MNNWADNTNCAVTVCDTEGVIIYQNEQSVAVNGDMRDKSMIPCHSDRSKAIIARLLAEGSTNAYTIEKKGIRKMIYQTAWRHEDGTVGGIIELTNPSTAEMPHYQRR